MPRRLAVAFALAGALAIPSLVRAAPDDAPAGGPAGAPSAAKGGPTYKNEVLGLSIQGPSGWQMAANPKSAPIQWMQLVNFYDVPTDTDINLNVRPRKSSSIGELRDAVQKEWSGDKTFTVLATRTVDATPLRPVPSVEIEATQSVTPPAAPRPKTGPGEVPPPPAPAPQAVSYYVSATYWLAPGYEYLVLARTRATLWSRIRPLAEAVRDSLLIAAQPAGPEGEGAFQDDANAFTCKYPRGYAVRLPQRSNHVVEFTGVSADAPVLGVYHFVAEGDVDHDAAQLVKYYTDDLSGEATTSPVEFGGKSGLLVTARANVGGKDQTVFIAICRRGEKEFFRFRAAVSRAQEVDGKKVFDDFLRSVKIGPAPQ
jgi:hypothetical protein